MAEPRTFTAGEREYLSSLAAVDAVDGRSCIHYADWFRAECMRRYQAGEKPAALFREAGLDPKLIGYNRIECAFARWRSMSPPSGTADQSSSDPRDSLIVAQALRIQQLEEELQALKQA